MIRVILIAFIITLSLLNAPQAHSEAPEQMRVGLILPLTRFSEYGVELKNGVELARKNNLEAFNRVTFIYEDSAMDGTKALSAYRKLATIDSADLIYSYGVGLAEILSPLADRYGVITFTSSTDPTTAIGRSNVFRFANSADAYGIPLAEELRARGIKQVVMLITENPYMEHLYLATKNSLGPEATFTELFRGAGDENDFRPYINRIRTGEYDAVGVFLFPGQISSFYNQLEQLRLDITTFGTDAFENREEIGRSGKRIEGAFFPNHDISLEFEDTYKKEYGQHPKGAFASLGYDLAMVISSIARSLYERPEHSVNEILQKGWAYDGVTGRIEFVEDSNGDKYFRFPVVMRSIREGSIVTAQDSEVNQ